MKVARIPLRPYTRFHFGELKFDHDLALTDTTLHAHSDTLFSALVHAYGTATEQAADFIKKLKSEELKFSSLFYYLQSKDCIVYFLPKPDFLAIESQKTKDGKHKKRNRIQFVSAEVWKMGFKAEDWFDESKFKILQNKFIVTIEEYSKLSLERYERHDNKSDTTKNTFSITDIVHVPKSPQRAHTPNASIFYQADVEIGGDDNITVGWYFLYEADGQHEKDLKLATNIMAYTGIGGKIKNTGRTIKGKPQFKAFDFTLRNQTSTKYINLSLLNPLEEKDFKEIIYYKTSLRGGRRLSLAGQRFTNAVRMINEGALINANTIKGRLVPLGNDEEDRVIYRNGTPFLLPVYFDEKTIE